MTWNKKLPCPRFISYALLFSVAFLIAHLAGFREYTNILSGTSIIETWQMFCGMIYLLLYVCVVGIVPILLIAAALDYAYHQLFPPQRKTSDAKKDAKKDDGF